MLAGCAPSVTTADAPAETPRAGATDSTPADISSIGNIPPQATLITAGGGDVQFGPPPPGADVSVDHATAVRNASANDWLPKTFTAGGEVVTFGLLTDPSYSRELAIDVRFTDVPDEIGPVGGPVAGVSTPVRSTPGRVNINIFLDAGTGNRLETVEDGIPAG